VGRPVHRRLIEIHDLCTRAAAGIAHDGVIDLGVAHALRAALAPYTEGEEPPGQTEQSMGASPAPAATPRPETDVFGEPVACATCNSLGFMQLVDDPTKLVRCDDCKEYRDLLRLAREVSADMWNKPPSAHLTIRAGEAITYLVDAVRALRSAGASGGGSPRSPNASPEGSPASEGPQGKTVRVRESEADIARDRLWCAASLAIPSSERLELLEAFHKLREKHYVPLPAPAAEIQGSVTP